MWDLANYQVLALSATSGSNIQVIIEDVIAGPNDFRMLDFKSEYEFVSGKSPLNDRIVVLPKGASILDSMVKECKETYSKSPVICILEDDQHEVFKAKLVTENFSFYGTGDLSELPNYNRGILLLNPKQYLGLNTPFAETATVLIGCEVKTEAQHHQMTGRSSRSRGVCHSILYVNTGEKEVAYR